MASIRVQVPDYNTYIDFPEGTTAETIRSAMEQNFPKKSSEWRQGTGNKAGATQADFIRDEGTLGTRFKEGVKTAMPYVRPVIEGVGATAGGIIGAGSGALSSMGLGTIPGGVAGASLGYAGGAKLSDMIESASGANSRPQPGTVTGQMGQSLKDLGTGAMFEMGGQAAPKVIGAVAKGVGLVAKPVLGTLSGTGSGAVEEAIKSGVKAPLKADPFKSVTTYDKALRGEIKGDDVVDMAQTALNRIKQNRSAAYQADLQKVTANNAPINTTPIHNELQTLMASYNVKMVPVIDNAGNQVINAAGRPAMKVDTSRIAMGKTGRNDIEEIIDTVNNWGSSQGDNTPLGLDVLKRQLDDFYSDSSQARQFVTALRNKVKDTIVTAVPQYDDMTKGYTEATKIIKDIESGLMTRKQGMSGRITADQTLRRLMSSMKDNFALRRDLVEVLGKEGGEDLSGAIAGYAQNAVLPRGIQANLLTTGAGIGAVSKMLDPSWGALLAASSPRLQGEFLRMLGKGIKATNIADKATKPVQGAIARQMLIQGNE